MVYLSRAIILLLVAALVGCGSTKVVRVAGPSSPPTYTCQSQQESTDSADVCRLAVAYLIDTLRAMQASTLFKTFAKQNPGEIRRFTAYLALDPPATWDETYPLRADMLTPVGAMLRDIVSACKVLLCPSSPLPNAPPSSAYPDHKPPSIPTNLNGG